MIGAPLQGLVVLRLVFVDQAFDRNMGKQGIPAKQDQCLPQPPHAAVAVGEGVDELELVVKDRAGDQRMLIGRPQPMEQVVHQEGDTIRRRRHVDDLLAGHHAHASAPVGSGLIQQTGHQDTMGLQQVLFNLGLPLFEAVIGGEGVARFLDFPGRGDNPLPVQNRGDLLLAQGVAFDGQRALNGANAIDAPQPQRGRGRDLGRQSPDRFGNFRHQTEADRGQGKGRLIGGLVAH